MLLRAVQFVNFGCLRLKLMLKNFCRLSREYWPSTQSFSGESYYPPPHNMTSLENDCVGDNVNMNLIEGNPSPQVNA